MTENMRRNITSFKQKIEIIEAHEKFGKSCRQLAEEFHIGKTQVANILKRKHEIRAAYSGDNAHTNGRKRQKIFGNLRLEQLDEATWQWFIRARAHQLPISGPIIQTMAMKFAEQLGILATDFKASNGWLQRFKSRHTLVAAALSGEKASVHTDDVQEWQEHLNILIKDYEPRNIFNLGETGLYFRALPDCSLVDEERAGLMKTKQRLTVMLCVNMLGEFEKPLVIGHRARPRCFKKINECELPVVWKFNENAWMTSAIWIEWLINFNTKMMIQQREVILFTDNAACHVGVEMSNVKLSFFPSSCASVSLLQPLEQGITKSVKDNYRKRLLMTLLKELDIVKNLNEINKTIKVLDACYWIGGIVKELKPEMVIKCFTCAGFVKIADPPTLVSSLSNDSDEDNIPLNKLAKQMAYKLGIADDNIDDIVDIYVNVDKDAAIVESLGEGWEDQIVEDILYETIHESEKPNTTDIIDGTDNLLLAETDEKSHTFQHIYEYLRMINEFATNKGYADVVEKAHEMERLLVMKQFNARKQATL